MFSTSGDHPLPARCPRSHSPPAAPYNYAALGAPVAAACTPCRFRQDIILWQKRPSPTSPPQCPRPFWGAAQTSRGSLLVSFPSLLVVPPTHPYLNSSVSGSPGLASMVFTPVWHQPLLIHPVLGFGPQFGEEKLKTGC